MRALTRITLALIAAFTLATATAQADDTAISQFAGDAAYLLDGILFLRCPDTTLTFDDPMACLEHGTDINAARAAWEAMERRYAGLAWQFGPWERYGLRIARFLRVDPIDAPAFLVAVILEPSDAYGTIAWLVDASETFAGHD
jgi:hypothetical protein